MPIDEIRNIIEGFVVNDENDALVKSCLQYSKAKDEPYKSIGLNCKNAIIRIALDHRINELRVNDWFNKEISAKEIQEAKANKK